MRLLLLVLCIAAFSVTGCSSGGGGSGGGTNNQNDFTCTTVTSYSDGITITGTARYEYRSNGNGSVATPNPIRQAEVAVYNSSGSVVQCGTTDESGSISVVVPKASDTYTLRVNAQIYNSTSKIFVFNNPSDRAVHYISQTFTPDSSKSLGILTAQATGDLKGGAFNILDKVHSANEYLLTQTSNCNNTFSYCTPFTGAPKVSIFWDKGVNPGDYFAAGPISFYYTGHSELYILGGDQGDVDNSDCDHFDNSVIIHEYGHFIEDMFAKTDTPGGSHSGDTILDARLAWGEGWADFFQAAILNNPLYRDTSGNVSGTTTVLFNEDLETPTNDIPSTLGEGNFREFSITRLLWDAIDAANEPGVDNVQSTFAELWTVFTSASFGFMSSSHHFRNMGLFHELQQALPDGAKSDWSLIRTSEKQRGDQQDYARSTTQGGACSNVTIQAQNVSGFSPENGTPTNSNQFASNDFYQIYHAGGSFNLQLSYTTNSAAPADLDLYLYAESYNFLNDTNLKGSSTANVNIGTSSATETISLSSLAAGYYMINVRVDTGVRMGDSASYSMTLGGQSLCPN